MEQNEINIYAILENVPSGTEFYSPFFGNISLHALNDEDSRGAIEIVTNSYGGFGLNKYGKFEEEGEVAIYPSKENRDWEKFAESLKPAFKFEVGKLYFFMSEDEDGDLPIIGEVIDECVEGDTLTFGNQLDMETDRFVVDQDFDLRISAHKELRPATDEECEEFEKAEHGWQCEQEEKRRAKAELKSHKFKTFEKVLARKRDEEEWFPALYIRKNGSKDKVFCISLGLPLDVSQCIPYEGSEYLAFTSDPF